MSFPIGRSAGMGRCWAVALGVLAAQLTCSVVLAQESRPTLTLTEGIEFTQSDGQALTLDVFRIEPSEEPVPVIIWIPDAGGDDRDHVVSPATALARDAAVVSVNYRADASLTDQLKDVKAAVRWVRDNGAAYEFEDSIAAFGFGRGALLAALLGTTADVPEFDDMAETSARVQAIVALAGPMTSGEITPVTYASSDDAPTYMVVGTADADVSNIESQMLMSALNAAGGHGRLDLVMGAGHEPASLLTADVMNKIRAFLVQNLTGVPVETGAISYVNTPPGWIIDPNAVDMRGTDYVLYPAATLGDGKYGSFRIYLPPTYEEDAEARYPVIYFFHGRDSYSWRAIQAGYVDRVDAAIRAGVMPPAIVVMPQGFNQGWYIDTEDGERPMASVFLNDIMPYVESNYRTIESREGRAMEGHSMGGYGALYMAFANPDLFAAVTANSAALINDVTNGVGSQAYWEERQPLALAEQNLDAVKQMRVRMIVGDQDNFVNPGTVLHEQLLELGVENEFIPVANAPHNIDEVIFFENYDRMEFYGEVFENVTD